MLERIEEIKGIGLLHDLNGQRNKLQKATLIYADNGRGKSTLSTIMRSLSTGDGQLITERKTIDGTLSPKVVYQFGSGHKVKFENSVWTEQRPELLVFDLDFIEKNVHSGGAVSTIQRKSLLEFALGTAAVTARQLEVQATAESSTSNAIVTDLTKQLAGYHQGYSLTTFEQLPITPDADTQIAELKKRILAAGNVTSILAKPVPSIIQVPSFNLDALFSILEKSLNDIQDDAEKIVHEHINLINKVGSEGWLSSGQQFDNGQHCPYCGQDTSANIIIQAYRTHFNEAYTELKRQVASLERGITARTNEVIAESFSTSIENANKIISSWMPELSLEPANFDKDKVATQLAELQQHLLKLATIKQDNPTISVIEEQDKSKAYKIWDTILLATTQANQQIEKKILKIDDFRKNLTNENTSQLEIQIAKLEAGKKRHDSTVIELISRFASAKIKAAESEKNKIAARKNLETLMSAVLGKFQKSINQLLIKFGASFKIEKMDANFRGGAPRSEYGLHLRGKSVPLEGGPPKFTTALSEGDKRTLALAFFVATTLDDPNLSNRIIVIDDPMCSLDINRKQHTKTVLKQLHDGAEQLIVLAHDPYFIRDLRDELTPKNGISQVSLLQLRHSANDYSDLEQFNVDHECESPYYRHHRMLSEFCSSGVQSPRDVAKAIRPFLEGYLHRRFPGHIPRDQMFGQVLGFINESTQPNPVVFAKSLVSELQEINTYAGQFHHDTNPGNVDSVQVVHSELKAFCQRALRAAHSGRVETI